MFLRSESRSKVENCILRFSANLIEIIVLLSFKTLLAEFFMKNMLRQSGEPRSTTWLKPRFSLKTTYNLRIIDINRLRIEKLSICQWTAVNHHEPSGKKSILDFFFNFGIFCVKINRKCYFLYFLFNWNIAVSRIMVFRF